MYNPLGWIAGDPMAMDMLIGSFIGAGLCLLILGVVGVGGWPARR